MVMIICFACDINVAQFGVAGGTVGVFCSMFVLSSLKISILDKNAGNSMLFWRTICDLGVGSRLMLGPAFDMWQCGQVICSTTSKF